MIYIVKNLYCSKSVRFKKQIRAVRDRKPLPFLLPALSAAYHLQLLVLHYRDTRRTSFKDPANTPLLRRKHGNVTYTYFKKTLKEHMGNLGEDPTFLTSHSLRIGGATALLAAGASETAVKQAGRWLSSDMPQLYAHASSSSVMAFSDRMLTTRSLQADSRHHILGWF